MYRGTWLLVGLPLLVAAFSVARPQAVDAAAAATDFDARPRARSRASSRATTPTARPARPARSAPAVGRRAARAYGFRPQRGRFEARSRAAAASRSRTSSARAGASQRHDRRHGAPRQHGDGPRRERQRLRHGRADRARPGYAPATGTGGQRGPRTRSSSSPPTAAPSARSGPRTSPRLSVPRPTVAMESSRAVCCPSAPNAPPSVETKTSVWDGEGWIDSRARRGSVRARELDQRCGPGRVVVCAATLAAVVAVRRDHDRALRRAADDDDEVLQPHSAEAGNLGREGVRPRLEAIELDWSATQEAAPSAPADPGARSGYSRASSRPAAPPSARRMPAGASAAAAAAAWRP